MSKLGAVLVASIVAVGLGVSALASAASATTSPSPASSSGPVCLGAHDDAWPAWTDGTPAGYAAGADGGVYLWHDAGGWHVRVTHKTDDRLYMAGTITTPGYAVDVTGVELEANDHFGVSANHHVITFQFNNYGHVDGLDFRTECAPVLSMAFVADGHQLPAGRVVIGAADAHPATNPFSIWRSQ